MTLRADQFAEFFDALWGKPPFPWQQRLAEEVVTHHAWPDTLRLPTGSGKTATIDIALFHLALAGQRAARRIAFVVDRRLVVDDAHHRALAIRNKLVAAADGILAEVRHCLVELGGDHDRPFGLARLRGGVPREPSWVSSAATPIVVTSTVAQFGSRLLFRGYGVSERMAPVHAGLFGHDCLALFDEAHLSQPFLTTLAAINQRLEAAGHGPLLQGRRVFLSATPRLTTDRVFTLGAEDQANSDLAKRLNASKPASLRSFKPTRGATAKPFVDAALSLSRLGQGSAQRTLVVVNRVNWARAVFDQLRRGLPAGSDIRLAIGRRRPIDNFKVDDLRADPNREDPPAPIILVATQTVEAGADLDVEALVTELAPIDALRQRFGRLNRLGMSDTASAIILTPEGLDKAEVDPVYGATLKPAAEYLGSLAIDGTVEFGLAAQSTWQVPPEAESTALEPPLLLPQHIDLLVNTAPISGVGPEIGPFLYGKQPMQPPVRVAWREEVALYDNNPKRLAKLLHHCPVLPEEVLEVPLHHLRQWLTKRRAEDLDEADIALDDLPLRGVSPDLRVFRWAGLDSPLTQRIPLSRVMPNDLIVLHPIRGGCDTWGWAPDSTARVVDMAVEAARRRGRAITRLHPDYPTADPLDAEQAAERRRQWLADSEAPDSVVIKRVLGDRDHKGARLLRDDDGRPVLVIHHAPDPAQDATDPTDDAATEDDDRSSTATRGEVSLATHAGEVAALARQTATGLGLPEEQVDILFRAGWFHDAGKAADGFQRFLAQGDPLAPYRSEKLGKSGQPVKLSRQDRQQMGFPVGARHEVASLHYARHHPVLAASSDPDLVLYLVGTHHGYGRPLFPGVAWPQVGDEIACNQHDPNAVTVTEDLATLSTGWMALVERVRKRHSPWTLAYLEAVLRLSDHQASAATEGYDPATPSGLDGPPPQRDPLAPVPVGAALPLVGLEADNLLGFLALVGTLAALDLARPDWQARIHWSGEPGHPVLSLATPATEAEVAAALADGLTKAAPAFALEERKLIDWTPEEFRRWLISVAGDPVPIASALAIEYPVRQADKLLISPYALQLGPSHQNVLERLRRAVTGADMVPPSPRTRRPSWTDPLYLAEALFHPWTRADDSSASLRWDAAEDQRYALRHGSPSKAGAASTNHGANRLAALGLAFLPCAPLEPPVYGGSCRQAGATRRANRVEFRWPIWSVPWTLPHLVAVLASRSLQAEPLSAPELPSGVTAVMACTRVSNQKLLNVTRAAPLPLDQG